MALTPIIPTSVTVHLGSPDEPARNVTVPFPEYIKNVASSEIYPTWPENALRANILAQISFALNRIYTEYYRSRGYDFDITNNTSLDQAFVYGRDVFENISQIVDEIFNNYIVREGSIEPLYALYCNGTTVSCNGLSQWGTSDSGKCHFAENGAKEALQDAAAKSLTEALYSFGFISGKEKKAIDRAVCHHHRGEKKELSH